MFVAVQSRDWHHAAQVPTQLFDVQESLRSEVSSTIPVAEKGREWDRLRRRRGDGEERLTRLDTRCKPIFADGHSRVLADCTSYLLPPTSPPHIKTQAYLG